MFASVHPAVQQQQEEEEFHSKQFQFLLLLVAPTDHDAAVRHHQEGAAKTLPELDQTFAS